MENLFYINDTHKKAFTNILNNYHFGVEHLCLCYCITSVKHFPKLHYFDENWNLSDVWYNTQNHRVHPNEILLIELGKSLQSNTKMNIGSGIAHWNESQYRVAMNAILIRRFGRIIVDL